LPIIGQQFGKAALAQRASAAKNSGGGVSGEDVISRMLRLGRSMNEKLAIVAKLRQ
jgi:hypothetical protein